MSWPGRSDTCSLGYVAKTCTWRKRTATSEILLFSHVLRLCLCLGTTFRTEDGRTETRGSHRPDGRDAVASGPRSVDLRGSPKKGPRLGCFRARWTQARISPLGSPASYRERSELSTDVVPTYDLSRNLCHWGKRQPIWHAALRGPPCSENDIFYAVSRYDERTSVSNIDVLFFRGQAKEGGGLHTLGTEDISVGGHKAMSGYWLRRLTRCEGLTGGDVTATPRPSPSPLTF